MTAQEMLTLLNNVPDRAQFTDFKIRGVSLDSRTVSKDYCFIAIPGTRSDGHDFIETALSKGGRLIFYEKGRRIDPALSAAYREAVFVGVENPRRSTGKIAAAFYGFPAEKLSLTGITGTNGKTTISFVIDTILNRNNFPSGLIGTIVYKIADHTMPAPHTTPDAVQLQHLLHHMVDHGLTHAVMEVSSHALDQYRIEGIRFRQAVFTNLTHEHLDYHGDKETYFQVKSRLFTELDKTGAAVINSDDEYGRRLRQMTPARIIDYAIEDKQALVRAENIVLGLRGTAFTAVTPRGKQFIETKLIGRHNVYNILAGLCVGIDEGIALADMAAAIAAMDYVPGRLERIPGNRGFETLVDYAHTDDALKNVLSTLREIGPRRIIVVFGCGGDRDRRKRPLMGKVASELADYLVVTNDNPRNEDPEKIIEAIKSGFDPAFKAFKVIPDREQAIAHALAWAQENDFVLIAGKGHENYQIFKDRTIAFDDRSIVRDLLKE